MRYGRRSAATIFLSLIMDSFVRRDCDLLGLDPTLSPVSLIDAL